MKTEGVIIPHKVFMKWHDIPDNKGKSFMDCSIEYIKGFIEGFKAR